MRNIMEITDAADLIVNGYAFTKAGQYVKVLNLNRPEKAAVLNQAGEVIETSMDDVELDIVLDYYKRNCRQQTYGSRFCEIFCKEKR